MSKKVKTAADASLDFTASQAVEHTKPPFLVLGAKAPKHRATHNGAAWSAITPLLPATAATLAVLPEVKACGGPKGNGMLMVSYCIRRGWLMQQA